MKGALNMAMQIGAPAGNSASIALSESREPDTLHAVYKGLGVLFQR